MSKLILFKILRDLCIVDASFVRLQGKGQHLERIHVCFDLNNNRIDQLKVTDEHVAESLAHFSMKSGRIFTGYHVYGTVKNCAYTIKQGADFILRITPQNFPIYDINGNCIDYKTLRPVGKEQTRETRFLIKAKDKHGKIVSTYLVCIIVGRIPKSKMKAAQERKKSKVKKKTTQYSSRNHTKCWLYLSCNFFNRREKFYKM